MRKIIFFILIFSSFQTVAKVSDISTAVRLISEKKLDEAYLILTDLVSNNTANEQSKIKALQLLSTYPVGTNAYATRHIVAKSLYEDKKNFEKLNLEDQLFIYRTGGLGAFQAGEWSMSTMFFEKILQTVDSVTAQDDLGLALEYLGWIKINQSRFLEVIQFWTNALVKYSLNSVWKSAMSRDLGQAIGEYLTEANYKEISDRDIKNIIDKLDLDKFKVGLKQGIERSNFDNKKIKLLIERVKNIEFIHAEMVQLFFDEPSFAASLPCFVFDLDLHGFTLTDLNKNILEKKIGQCWNVLKTTNHLQNDVTLKSLYRASDLTNAKLTMAEIDETIGNIKEACLYSIPLNETSMAIRNCQTFMLKDESSLDQVITLLVQQNTPLNWIGLWDLIFTNSKSKVNKHDWLIKNAATPEIVFKLIADKNEYRPLIWWFEESMNNLANNIDVDPVWNNEFLKIDSKVWKYLKISKEAKYQAILSLSLKSKINLTIISSIADIESSLKAKSPLETMYLNWLNSYVFNENQLTAQIKNAHLYNLWSSSFAYIKKFKNADFLGHEAWKKKNKNLILKYPEYIPMVALYFSNYIDNFEKIEKIKLDLKSSSFARKLNQSIKLMTHSIQELQNIAKTDARFSDDTELMRNKLVTMVIDKISSIKAPKEWPEKDQTLWETEKNKILDGLKGANS